VWERENAHRFLVGEPEEKVHFEGQACIAGCELDLYDSGQKPAASSCKHHNDPFHSRKSSEFST
jgi:hypothetical protein